MEFLLYLSSQSSEIYQMISQKVRVAENTPVCRKYNIFGFFDSSRKEFSICTNKIKSFGDYNLKGNIEATFLHESTHVAQACKTKQNVLEPFGISPSIMKLSSSQHADLRKVIAFDSRLKYVDMEAFWMEDKPDKVKYVVQKYCL